jgi:ParB/RepB/Spo0J family partition protein
MATAQKDALRFLPLVSIRPSEVALRSVDKDDEKYHGIRDSIAQHGVINPISVREMKDNETGKTVYGIIDGLHRYTGSIDAGLDTIPAHIIQADEAKVLEMQIIGNLHVVETKPAEYSKQLHKLLALNPTMTTLELANKLGKSITWLSERFNLVKLSENIQELVNDGTINITNACNLAKLPPEEQVNFVDRAITMTPSEFVPTVTIRAKQIRDAKRQGKSDTGPKEFEPPVFMQKLSALKSELKDLNIGKGLINQYGIRDPIDAWKMAIAWALHLDPASIEASRLEDEERKKLNEENKAKKKAERDKKKRSEAAGIAAGLALDEDNEDEE